MPASVSLKPCRTTAEWRLFERLPEFLHADDPRYVPPFPGDVMKLRSTGHPFHRDGSIAPFLAYRNGRPVGRIAAVVNRTHNEFHRDRTGFFGFFDFEDAEVAGHLLSRARAHLAEAGFDTMRGPFSPTQNDQCGLQVDGAWERPYFGMPFNPESYPSVYESLGLRGVRDLLAYDVHPGLRDDFEARLGRLADRVRKRFPITVRPVDISRFDEEVALVSRLFNDTLAGEWNFMPLSIEAASAFSTDLLGHLDPEAILIAELEGRPVGLSIGLPDANEVLADVRRGPRWLRWPRIVWRLKTRGFKRARWAVFGMLPEFRRRGTTALLIYEAIKHMEGRYASGELSWTQDGNDEVNELAIALGLVPYKRYRVFEGSVS